MVNWLEGASRARYSVSGLVLDGVDSILDKSIKRNGLE
jgi:hypothetical protein